MVFFGFIFAIVVCDVVEGCFFGAGFGEGSCAGSAEFLHVCADAENFAYVVAEFAYVGSAFASDFEEDISAVFFYEFVVVYASCAELSFDGGSEGGALVDFIFELGEDVFYFWFIDVSVEF